MRVFFIDDEATSDINLLLRQLRRYEYFKEVYSYSSVREAKEDIVTLSSSIDMVIIDQVMPEEYGTIVGGWINQNYPHIICIMLTGAGIDEGKKEYRTIDVAVEAMENGFCSFLEKKDTVNNIDTLYAKLDRILSLPSVQAKQKAKKELQTQTLRAENAEEENQELENRETQILDIIEKSSISEGQKLKNITGVLRTLRTALSSLCEIHISSENHRPQSQTFDEDAEFFIRTLSEKEKVEELVNFTNINNSTKKKEIISEYDHKEIGICYCSVMITRRIAFGLQRVGFTIDEVFNVIQLNRRDYKSRQEGVFKQFTANTLLKNTISIKGQNVSKLEEEERFAKCIEQKYKNSFMKPKQ